MKKEAFFYQALDGNKVHCSLCAHGCTIADQHYGICGVRKNEGGILFTYAYNNPIALNIDPIEKKPLYHFLPHTYTYSLATFGCNFQCSFCQNWQISQTREIDKLTEPKEVNPEQIVKNALDSGCQSISYTYTEPTIFFEYAYDTAVFAHQAGLKNIFVTNGYMSGIALKTIAPYLDAANVDLKSFSNEFYLKTCKAKLAPVLETIKAMHELNIWVEITTLIIPGENDSQEELAEIANFIASVSKDIPWHISRFHPDYKFLDHDYTAIETLKLAEDLGKQAGLKYVHLGNVPLGV